MKSDGLDELDRRILMQLQDNAALTHAELAQRVHSSAPTCMRRVQRLRETGWIEREVALLNAEKVAQAYGAGLHAVVEVSLEQQTAAWLDEFERAACARAEVQQCWRTSAGPDFVLIVCVPDMPRYQLLATELFASDRRVRNVKTYFATKRAKFGMALPLPAGESGTAAPPNTATPKPSMPR